MRAGVLLLIMICAGCRLDLSGVALCLSSCPEEHDGNTGGGNHRVVFRVQPSNTVVGEVIAPTIEVAIVDGAGNVVARNDSITIRIWTNPAAGTLTGTLRVATTRGTATFGDLSIDGPGEGFALIASADRYGNVVSSQFNVSCTCD
jgi:hypothetical protein